MPRARKPKPSPESPRLPTSFDVVAMRAPRRHHSRTTGLGSWTRDAIAAAVAAQIRGTFSSAVQLQRSLLKEPAIFAASENRLAPQRGLAREVSPPKGAVLAGTSSAILEEARRNFTSDSSVALSPGVIADDHERLVFHGFAVGQVVWAPRGDGSREDPVVTPWPLEATEWSESDRMLIATTTDGRVPIEHGDGRWVVVRKHSDTPWRRGAIVPLGTIWPDLAFGRRDRSLNAQSHGDDKWLGFLPEGVAIDSPEGAAMLDELEHLYDFQRASIFAHGAQVRRDQSTSTNWQIFKELLESDDKAAQKILLGQDGTMTNSGGSYVKAWGLFGVRNDLVEGDLSSLGAAYSTGLVRPWSIVNFGRWDRLAYQWLIPDADEDARRESLAARSDAFFRTIDAARKAGFVVDQAMADRLAEQYGLGKMTLESASASAPSDGAPAEATDASAPTVSVHRRALRAVPARV